jgi:hypothetical protein
MVLPRTLLLAMAARSAEAAHEIASPPDGW